MQWKRCFSNPIFYFIHRTNNIRARKIMICITYFFIWRRLFWRKIIEMKIKKG